MSNYRVSKLLILLVEVIIPYVLLIEVKLTHGEKGGTEHWEYRILRLISIDHRKSYFKIMLAMLRK